MTTEPCDGCGKAVKIGGSFANVWDMNQESTGGLSLELVDGSEFFLCYDCIDQLPDDRDVVAEDVHALEES